MINQSVLQDHIDRLAQQLNCLVVQRPEMSGMMFVEYEPPMIEGPTLSDLRTIQYPNLETRYLTMLHELGHVYHGHTQGRPPYQNKTWYFENGVLNSEAEAWDWALNNMLFTDLHPDTVVTIRDNFLGSYHAYALSAGLNTPGQKMGNGNRHWVTFSFGDDTSTRQMRSRMTSLMRTAVPA